MRMCVNKKVLMGAGVVALGVLVFAPQLMGGALPLLFLAVCPLSMVLMMRGMGGTAQRTAEAPSDTALATPAQRPVSAPSPDGTTTPGTTARELQDKLRALQAQQVALEDQLRAHQSVR